MLLHISGISKLIILFFALSLIAFSGSASQKDRLDKPIRKLHERKTSEVKELVQIIQYLLSDPKGIGLSMFYIHDNNMVYSDEIADQIDVVKRYFGTVTSLRETEKPRLGVDCTVGIDDDEYWSKKPTVHTEYLEVIYEKNGRGYLIIEIADIDSEFEIKLLKFGVLPENENEIHDKIKSCSELVERVRDKHNALRHKVAQESQKLRASRLIECGYVSRQGVKLIELMSSGMEGLAAKKIRYQAVDEVINSHGVKESWETDKIESQKRTAHCFLGITTDIVFSNHWGENDVVNFSRINKICQSEKLDYVSKCAEAR